MSHIKLPTQTKKKSFNIETTYYLITQKNTHVRELTQLYSFTGLKIIQNEPHLKNTEQNDNPHRKSKHKTNRYQKHYKKSRP